MGPHLAPCPPTSLIWQVLGHIVRYGLYSNAPRRERRLEPNPRPTHTVPASGERRLDPSPRRLHRSSLHPARMPDWQLRGAARSLIWQDAITSRVSVLDESTHESSSGESMSD